MSQIKYYHTFSLLLTKFFFSEKNNSLISLEAAKLPRDHFLGAGRWEDHEDGGTGDRTYQACWGMS
jgi:hypothetical protein